MAAVKVSPILKFIPTEQMPTYHSLAMSAVEENQAFQLTEELAKHLLADFPQNWHPMNKKAKELQKVIAKEAAAAETILAVQLSVELVEVEEKDTEKRQETKTEQTSEG